MRVYDGFHKVEKKTVIYNGSERVIEKVLLKSAVAGVVIDAENKIALVKQYRPCVENTMYELPAGLLDKELSLEETLIEELEEECGINRNDIESISKPVDYYMVCGSSDAKMHLMVVKLSSIEESKEVNDADVERVDWITLEALEEMVDSGEISDSKTLMGYYILKTQNKI